MIGRRSLVTLLVGVVVAAVAGLVMAADARGDVRDRLEERTDRVAAVVELQLERYGSASRAVAALRSDDPPQPVWEARVERLGIARDLTSVYSVGAATLEPGPRVVIDRVAPLEPNRQAIGLDVLTVAGARPAALRAVEQGEVSLSDALTLIQEPDDQTGLVVYAPWYLADGTVGGATNLVLRGQDFLDALTTEIGDLHVVLTDEVEGGTREIGRLGSEVAVDGPLVVRRTIEPLGQRWEVTVAAPPGFASTSERLAGILTALGVLLLAVLLAALVAVLQRREEHAREEVRTRTAELVAANRDLEEALTARDQFLAVITHEFRTPIAVIRGFAETAAAGRSGEVPAETRDWLDRIDRQARRLHTLVDNVLTAASLRSGDLEVRPEVVDVASLARAVADQHPALTPLRVDLDPPLLAVVDPGHFVRVLDALLSNAGIYGRPPVVVEGGQEGAQVCVRVRDAGDGVTGDAAMRIFAPFEQADRGDTRRSRGVGLGLSLVHDLLQQMDGTVALVDGGGTDGGACFEVRVPGAPDGAGEGAEVASPTSPTDEA